MGHISGPPTGVLVSDLLDHSTHTWDIHKINLVCSAVDAATLLNNPGPVRFVSNSLVWTPVATKSYTTTAGFELLRRVDHPDPDNNTRPNFLWNDFWRTKC